MTSRLKTSRYGDFSQFFESIVLGLKNFGLEKKSRYRSRKYLVSKKVSVSVSKKSLGISLKNFGLKKSSSYADIIFQRDTSNTFKDFVS